MYYTCVWHLCVFSSAPSSVSFLVSLSSTRRYYSPNAGCLSLATYLLMIGGVSHVKRRETSLRSHWFPPSPPTAGTRGVTVPDLSEIVSHALSPWSRTTRNGCDPAGSWLTMAALTSRLWPPRDMLAKRRRRPSQGCTGALASAESC